MPETGIGAGVAAEARNGLRSQLQRAERVQHRPPHPAQEEQRVDVLPVDPRTQMQARRLAVARQQRADHLPTRDVLAGHECGLHRLEARQHPVGVLQREHGPIHHETREMHHPVGRSEHRSSDGRADVDAPVPRGVGPGRRDIRPREGVGAGDRPAPRSESSCRRPARRPGRRGRGRAAHGEADEQRKPQHPEPHDDRVAREGAGHGGGAEQGENVHRVRPGKESAARCYTEHRTPLRRGDYACPREAHREIGGLAAPASTSLSHRGFASCLESGCAPGHQGS